MGEKLPAVGKASFSEFCSWEERRFFIGNKDLAHSASATELTVFAQLIFQAIGHYTLLLHFFWDFCISASLFET
jgi:hypothetical protein